jgi:hypothetical protein
LECHALLLAVLRFALPGVTTSDEFSDPFFQGVDVRSTRKGFRFPRLDRLA